MSEQYIMVRSNGTLELQEKPFLETLYHRVIENSCRSLQARADRDLEESALFEANFELGVRAERLAGVKRLRASGVVPHHRSTALGFFDDASDEEQTSDSNEACPYKDLEDEEQRRLAEHNDQLRESFPLADSQQPVYLLARLWRERMNELLDPSSLLSKAYHVYSGGHPNELPSHGPLHKQNTSDELTVSLVNRMMAESRGRKKLRTEVEQQLPSTQAHALSSSSAASDIPNASAQTLLCSDDPLMTFYGLDADGECDIQLPPLDADEEAFCVRSYFWPKERPEAFQPVANGKKHAHTFKPNTTEENSGNGSRYGDFVKKGFPMSLPSELAICRVEGGVITTLGKSTITIEGGSLLSLVSRRNIGYVGGGEIAVHSLHARGHMLEHLKKDSKRK